MRVFGAGLSGGPARGRRLGQCGEPRAVPYWTVQAQFSYTRRLGELTGATSPPLRRVSAGMETQDAA